jgi:single-stranded-DNA-specific exonuclease
MVGMGGVKRFDWRLSPPDWRGRHRICRELLIHPVTAQVLLNRGMNNPAEAFAFLYGAVHHDPFRFIQMETVVERIIRAVEGGEGIFVFGDYDVDGITGTVALVDFLRRIGARVGHMVPNRLTQGYDLSPKVVADTKAAGYGLLVTNDCGVTAHDAARHARELGLDLIITDHHLPDDELPDALAIINGNVAGSGYPFSGLAGVGTVFKVVSALSQTLGRGASPSSGSGPDPEEYLDLVALGTVADVSPLVDENRALVVAGLARMNSIPRLGLAALIDSAGLGGRRIGAKQLSYVLAPRLNAAGRIAAAEVGVDLLLSEDADEAYRLAMRVESLNRQRRMIESETTREAMALAEDDIAFEEVPVIVVGSNDWHPGVVGIVAARLADRFARPALVFGEMGRGSARGYGDFDVIGALDECADVLEDYGGHLHAAGVRIKFPNLPELRRRINEIARRKPIAPHPLLEVDAELRLTAINEQLLWEIERLDPYGIGNPEPVFHAGGVTLADEPRVVGKNHLKLVLSQDGASLEAIAFGRADLASYLPRTRPFDVAYHLERNTFHTGSHLQLRVLDFDLAERVEFGRGIPLSGVSLDDRRDAGAVEDLEEMVAAGPTVIYAGSGKRRTIQRFLALRGYLPATVPGARVGRALDLDSRHYLFWETLALGGFKPMPEVWACICEPFDNPYDAILLRELARIARNLHLVLLYERHDAKEQHHRRVLDRVRLAEIYRDLPKDGPFSDDIIVQLSDRWLTRGEARLALSIFLDLGLLTRRNGSYEVVSVQDRRDLTKSFTYQRLVRFGAEGRRFLRQQMELDGRELLRLLYDICRK